MALYARSGCCGVRPTSLLENFRREMSRACGAAEHAAQENRGEVWFAPPTNVVEYDTGYEVTVDLPGVKSADFQVEWKDEQLHVSGQRLAEEAAAGKIVHCVERNYGQFRRVVALGREVNASQISAEYKDGVLKVSVPKAVAVQPHKIEVK